MLRKIVMIVAVCMICLPLGGQAQIALARYVGQLPLGNPAAQCWLGPEQIAIASACVFVLSLTAARRWL